MCPVVPELKATLALLHGKKNPRVYLIRVRCIETTARREVCFQREIELVLQEGTPFLIGRQSPESPFNNVLLSRRHAELLALDDKVFLIIG